MKFRKLYYNDDRSRTRKCANSYAESDSCIISEMFSRSTFFWERFEAQTLLYMIYHQSLFELILLVIPKIRFHFQLSVSPISSKKCCVICYALFLMRFIYHDEIYLIPFSSLSLSFACASLHILSFTFLIFHY